MKRLIILLIIFILSVAFSKGDEKKWALEFSSGYSFGLPPSYITSEGYWRNPPLSPEDKYYVRDEFSFPLRLAIKHYLSKRFVLQGEIEYQKQVYHRWGGSMIGYVDIKEDRSFVIPYLDLLYLFKEKKRTTPFVGIGLGISHFVYYIPFPNLRAGGGVQYEINNTFSIVLGSSLYYGRGVYLSIRLGLEYHSK